MSTKQRLRPQEILMNNALCDKVETGDVIEIVRDDELISALVLLATEDAVILDACDETTPFVVAREELVIYRLFNADAL